MKKIRNQEEQKNKKEKRREEQKNKRIREE